MGARLGRHEVLITRQAEEAERTASLVRALGLVPVIAPLLRVVPRSILWPAAFDATLLTSANAVPAAAACGVPVLAVGDSTAERARAAGLSAISARGDAAALLALARRHLPPGATVVLASGAGQGAALARDLRGAGFRVHRRVAYAVHPAPRLPQAALDALAGGRLGAALFLSAETARTFVRLLPRALLPALAGIEALAIAAPAAAVLAPLPWRRVRVSVVPTLDQVLALL